MQDAPAPRSGLRVLLVGGGGREHALAWKLAQSPLLGQLFAAPGNPGIAAYATCFDVAAEDVDGIVRLAIDHECDFVVVGPDDPLAAGLVDALHAAGILAFGPTQAAARIESSKAYARALVATLGVPGPRAASFTELEPALAFARQLGSLPVVVKADGLCRGKGVVIAATLPEAEETLRRMLVTRDYGDAGRAVVVEEFLQGEERSYFALCDGQRSLLLLPCQDHKRAYDGDQGPNTGGMGAIVPAFRPGDPSPREIRASFFAPVLKALRASGTPFRGVLFAGVMLTAAGPRLLEYNARFGDPETQAMLPLLESDLLPLLLAAAEGDLDALEPQWQRGFCVSVVMAAHGYPGPYTSGQPIAGLEAAAALPEVQIFHAGTRQQDGAIVTGGGRVLCVTARGATPEEANGAAYAAVRQIQWKGVHFRTDIGWEDKG